MGTLLAALGVWLGVSCVAALWLSLIGLLRHGRR